MNTRNIYVYRALNSQDINSPLEILKTPVNYIPFPSEEEYMIGYVDRFFVKKINGISVYETSEEDFDSVDLSMWQKVSINWKISGQSIEKHNREEINRASNVIEQIKNLLTNPLQFARF